MILGGMMVIEVMVVVLLSSWCCRSWAAQAEEVQASLE